MSEKEAYEFFDKWIAAYCCMQAIIFGYDYQKNINTWKFDICHELVKNGCISVQRVWEICGFGPTYDQRGWAAEILPSAYGDS